MNRLKHGIIVLTALLLTTAGWAEQDNAGQPLRLELDLADGSHIIGVPSITSVPVHTSYAKMDIPLEKIVSIEIKDDHETASFELQNGDRLKGVLSLNPIELETLFGKVSVGIEHIKRVDVHTAGSFHTMIKRGLVLYYPFDEQGERVEDKSGRKNHGANHGAKYTAKGKLQGAFKFDGKSAYVDLGSGSVADLPTWKDYTICVWFLNDGKGDHGRGYGQKIIDKTVMHHDFYLCIKADGSLCFTTYEGSGGGLSEKSHDYRDSKWHHAVVVKKGDHGELWVDGRLKDVKDNLKQVSTKAPLLAAYSKSSDGYQRKHWSGLIDELMIFNRPLSKPEIRHIFTFQK